MAAQEGSCIAFDPDNPLPPKFDANHPPVLNICGGIRRQIVSPLPDRRDHLEAAGISMPRLIEMLTDEVGRTIIDKTGFQARFDFHLDFTPDLAMAGNFGPAPPGDPGRSVPIAGSPGPSIFGALQEQLGLRGWRRLKGQSKCWSSIAWSGRARTEPANLC